MAEGGRTEHATSMSNSTRLDTSFLRQYRDYLNDYIGESYPELSEANSLEQTYQAMRYILFLGGGGKRLRPIVTLLTAEACGGRVELALPVAQAIEELHSYTLILDDIQDGDAYRRGKQACHKEFGVDTATLAASRLFQRALGVLYTTARDHSSVVRGLLDDLHRGQSADLNSRQWRAKDFTREAYEFVAGGKTATLFQLAVLGGGLSAGVDWRLLEGLVRYARLLGMAFQARDDILDDKELTVREGVGGSGESGVMTFRDVYPDYEEAQQQIRDLVNDGIEVLESLPTIRTERLQAIIIEAIRRQN